MRLDLPEDQQRLRETVALLRPTLLVLDPFVRLHRIDENAAAEVAPVLAYLRDLERHFHTAVLLVHHARKGAGHARAGQALRGSSELHAWGDSNLYLRRRGDTLCLALEHRAAPSRDGLVVELRAQGDALALHLVDGGLSPDRVLTRPAPALDERIEHAHAAHASCAAPRLPHPCQHAGSGPGPLARGRTRHPIAGRLLPRPLVVVSSSFPDRALLSARREPEPGTAWRGSFDPHTNHARRRACGRCGHRLGDVQGPVGGRAVHRAGTFHRPSSATTTTCPPPNLTHLASHHGA